MLGRSEAQINVLIRELYRFPRHVRWTQNTLELGSHWLDLNRVAALLSLTQIKGVPDKRFDRRAFLLDVTNKREPETGLAGCVFTLRSKPRVLREARWLIGTFAPSMQNGGGYLRALLWYYEYGFLTPHTLDRRFHLEKLLGCVLEAREQAARSNGNITDTERSAHA